jgi:hypothetical protein
MRHQTTPARTLAPCWVQPRLLDDRLDPAAYRPDLLEVLDRERRLFPHQVQLRTLADVAKGATPLWQGDAYLPSGTPFIRSGNIDHLTFRWSGLVYISDRVHQRMAASEVRGGDALLAIVGASIGRAALAPASLATANINQAVARIRPRDGRLDAGFLVAYLSGPAGQAKIRRAQAGAARDNLDLFQVRELCIPVVTAGVQRVTGACVRAAERRHNQAAAARRAIAQLLHAAAPEAYAIAPEQGAYWVGPARLDGRLDPGMYQPRYHDLVSRLRQAPTRHLGDLCRIHPPAASAHAGGARSYLEIGNVDLDTGTIGGQTDLACVPVPDGPKHLLQTNDILLSKVRPTRGAVVRVPGVLAGALATVGFARLRARRGVDPFFLWALLRQPVTAWQLERYAAGVTYPTIEEAYLGALVLPWPADAVRNEVATLARRACRLPYRARDTAAAARAHIERMSVNESHQ